MDTISPRSDETRQDGIFTRRQLMRVGGSALVCTTLLGGCASGPLARAMFPRVETGPAAPEAVGGAQIGRLNGGAKPIYVARPGSADPVEHSVADTLFWGEQLMEHAMFFAMLMPGAELAGPRGQAEQYQRQFTDHLARLRRSSLDRGDYVAFNNSTLALARPFIAYKRQMQQEQDSGRMHSLVWPLFFDHTAGEAERFVRRLEQLNRGDTSYSRTEVIPFWSDKMAEHAEFVSHLLDPDEDLLVKVTEETSDLFRGLERNPSRGGAETAVQAIIDFKTAAGRGIRDGSIDSIIHPALADHVRREAIRFQDELRRSA
ncbi:MAG TPA: DUF2935 domain-containing protein [Allosphingosinicella sp.]|nr:DUF2935 domain-containing protein [Allosphingosinicella sp.]